MIVLRFSMQGNDSIEHTNRRCHGFTLTYICKWKVLPPLQNVCPTPRSLRHETPGSRTTKLRQREYS